MSTSKVKEQLKKSGIAPNKLLGQHFLIDDSVVDSMLKNANLSSLDVILEIGPGLGILTEKLSRTGKQIFALEKDRALAAGLKKKFSKTKNIFIQHGDALSINPATLFKETDSYSIIANLPYNITARFFKIFLSEVEKKPQEIIVMVQKEVAERMVAKQGKLTKLGLLLQVYGDIKILVNDIPPTVFYPPPKVLSAVISVRLKRAPLKIFPQYEDIFWQLIRIGFASKRKLLANNLSAGLTIQVQDARKMLTLAEIEPRVRAEQLTIKNWVALVDIYRKNHCR